ncbi:MAG: DNA repair and recombination protein RadB [Halolamina sp.]
MSGGDDERGDARAAVGDGHHVPTGCDPLDELLGGGFERGTVSQVYGEPAAGKTNVVLSAAVQTAVAGGTVLYVDTEGLSLARLEQLVDARVDGDEAFSEAASRLLVTAAHDFAEQAEAVRDVEGFADSVDLVVLDSATGFYRLERADDEAAGDALRRVADQVTHLLSLARKHEFAVAVTNQVFTDPDSDRTKPLGGNTLEHWTGVVLRLDRFRGGNRRATLEKHRTKPTGESATFQITGDGLVGGEPR